MQVPLVLRGRRQAGLTAAGQALVEEGRKLLAASDDLVDIVRRRAASVGVVKVGVSAGVGIRLLPLVLGGQRRRAPGVDVKLEAAGSAEAMLRGCRAARWTWPSSPVRSPPRPGWP